MNEVEHLTLKLDCWSLLIIHNVIASFAFSAAAHCMTRFNH